jgi:benzoate membrane transport protein
MFKTQWIQLRDDASFSGFTAGFIATLVGMTSSAALVFQAASAAGGGAEMAGSWLGSLCIGMSILTIVLSIRTRTPILIAWSTAGAALIAGGVQNIFIGDLIGAFLFSSILIFLCGITGVFEKIMNRIPVPLASALLGGVLLHFTLDSFSAFKTQPFLIGFMFLTYVVSKRFYPRLSMLFVLIVGSIVAGIQGLVHFDQIQLSPTHFQIVMPHLSFAALLSIGIPLFIVTMASQNLTGITVMRANGYNNAISPLLTWTGLVNMVTAVFGGFALNLAAITAAIAMGPESHPNPKKRYFACVVSGVFYLILGFLAGTVTSLFAAFPSEMVMAIAGLALLGTVAGCLQAALGNESQKEAAFITFCVSASGISLFGIGSAFWGIVVGAMSLFILSSSKK